MNTDQEIEAAVSAAITNLAAPYETRIKDLESRLEATAKMGEHAADRADDLQGKLIAAESRLDSGIRAAREMRSPHDILVALGAVVEKGVSNSPCVHWVGEVRDDATHAMCRKCGEMIQLARILSEAQL